MGLLSAQLTASETTGPRAESHSAVSEVGCVGVDGLSLQEARDGDAFRPLGDGADRPTCVGFAVRNRWTTARTSGEDPVRERPGGE
ncbi:hypothetical protein DWB78_08005 [Halopelagius longus]|uniref:Uncharacterized protein n=1 Tax=Halopelagius longus TaxID=1236180 RepID=A0A370ILV5_9EURY|nr:hypothetical protein DWB78_08005 [Halopelagius longus]